MIEAEAVIEAEADVGTNVDAENESGTEVRPGIDEAKAEGGSECEAEAGTEPKTAAEANSEWY